MLPTPRSWSGHASKQCRYRAIRKPLPPTAFRLGLLPTAPLDGMTLPNGRDQTAHCVACGVHDTLHTCWTGAQQEGPVPAAAPMRSQAVHVETERCAEYDLDSVRTTSAGLPKRMTAVSLLCWRALKHSGSDAAALSIQRNWSSFKLVSDRDRHRMRRKEIPIPLTVNPAFVPATPPARSSSHLQALTDHRFDAAATGSSLTDSWTILTSQMSLPALSAIIRRTGSMFSAVKSVCFGQSCLSWSEDHLTLVSLMMSLFSLLRYLLKTSAQLGDSRTARMASLSCCISSPGLTRITAVHA